ncbi:hypothetical protein EV714DRAFT_240065 [Schizophyllum commune]
MSYGFPHTSSSGLRKINLTDVALRAYSRHFNLLAGCHIPGAPPRPSPLCALTDHQRVLVNKRVATRDGRSAAADVRGRRALKGALVKMAEGSLYIGGLSPDAREALVLGYMTPEVLLMEVSAQETLPIVSNDATRSLFVNIAAIESELGPSHILDDWVVVHVQPVMEAAADSVAVAFVSGAGP